MNKNTMIANLAYEKDDGQVAVVGAYKVDNVVCHYAFIRANGEYESQVGQLKSEVLNLLGLPFTRVAIKAGKPLAMKSQLRDEFSKLSAQGGQVAALFVFERTKKDDQIFYAGLGLDPEQVHYATAEAMGLVVSEPACTVPMQDIMSAPFFQMTSKQPQQPQLNPMNAMAEAMLSKKH